MTFDFWEEDKNQVFKRREGLLLFRKSRWRFDFLGISEMVIMSDTKFFTKKVKCHFKKKKKSEGFLLVYLNKMTFFSEKEVRCRLMQCNRVMILCNAENRVFLHQKGRLTLENKKKETEKGKCLCSDKIWCREMLRDVEWFRIFTQKE